MRRILTHSLRMQWTDRVRVCDLLEGHVARRACLRMHRCRGDLGAGPNLARHRGGSQLGIDISDFLFIFEIYKIYKFSLFKIYLSWQDLSNLHRSVALPSAFR